MQPKHPHGFLGDSSWANPRRVTECSADARPDQKDHTSRAHEYTDSPAVLRAKVKVLADLIRRAQRPIVYAGAGLSTASGIGDYASRSAGAKSLVARRQAATGKARVGFDARPTLAHRVIAAMDRAGFLGTSGTALVQQNHDGLPQKAGMCQSRINEIHGAWYDPSNPVVKMSGSLRDDLFADLLAVEDGTDFCLTVGTSLSGMNADRVAETVGAKARTLWRRHSHGADGEPLGTCIISLQETRLDGVACLRIFAMIDDVFSLLAEELGITNDVWPDKVLHVADLTRGVLARREVAEALAASPAAAATLPAPPATPEAPASARSVTVTVGNTHKVVAGGDATDATDATDANKHKWSMFVTATHDGDDDDATDAAAAIESVTYTLHPTFTPAVVTVTEAPFRLKRLGWGVFPVGVRVAFKPGTAAAPLDVTHMLSFDGTGASAPHAVDLRPDGDVPPPAGAPEAAAVAGAGAGAGASSGPAGAPSRPAAFDLRVRDLPGFTATNSVYDVPYDKNGRRMASGTRRLDVRRGKPLVITDGPYKGYTASVTGTRPDGSLRLSCTPPGGARGAPVVRILGLWWMAAAATGDVPTIPVVGQ